VSGKVCAEHKGVAKAKIKKYREARKAAKLGIKPAKATKLRTKKVARPKPTKAAKRVKAQVSTSVKKPRPLLGTIVVLSAPFLKNAAHCGLVGRWMAELASYLLGPYGTRLLVIALAVTGVRIALPRSAWAWLPGASRACVRRLGRLAASVARLLARLKVRSPATSPTQSSSREFEPEKLADLRGGLRYLGYSPAGDRICDQAPRPERGDRETAPGRTAPTPGRGLTESKSGHLRRVLSSRRSGADGADSTPSVNFSPALGSGWVRNHPSPPTFELPQGGPDPEVFRPSELTDHIITSVSRCRARSLRTARAGLFAAGSHPAADDRAARPVLAA
jgi:hypothetical protein